MPRWQHFTSWISNDKHWPDLLKVYFSSSFRGSDSPGQRRQQFVFLDQHLWLSLFPEGEARSLGSRQQSLDVMSHSTARVSLWTLHLPQVRKIPPTLDLHHYAKIFFPSPEKLSFTLSRGQRFQPRSPNFSSASGLQRLEGVVFQHMQLKNLYLRKFKGRPHQYH